jgi:hypothetical protein
MRYHLDTYGRIPAMDSGEIAIVGAAAGIIGAMVGGGCALGSAALTSRRQAKAQRDQWRRQVRRDAYAACLTAAHALLAGINDVLTAWTGGDAAEVDEVARRLHGLSRALRQADSVVKLEGPADLYGALGEMRSRLNIYAALVTAAGASAIALPTAGERQAAASRMRRNVAAQSVPSGIDAFEQQARQILDAE